MPRAVKYITLTLIVALATVLLLTVVFSGSAFAALVAVAVLSIPLSVLIYIFFSLREAFGPQVDPKGAAAIKTEGQKVMTTFRAIDRKWNISVNGQSPIVVYTQDKAGRTYESEQLWFSGGDSASYDDPRFQAWQKLQSAHPNDKYSIPVYIDLTNPQKYYMDLGDVRIM